MQLVQKYSKQNGQHSNTLEGAKLSLSEIQTNAMLQITKR